MCKMPAEEKKYRGRNNGNCTDRKWIPQTGWSRHGSKIVSVRLCVFRSSLDLPINGNIKAMSRHPGANT